MTDQREPAPEEKKKFVSPEEYDKDAKVEYPDPDEGVGDLARPPSG